MVNAADTELGLAARVRALTRADHEAAETTPFVSDLMAGRLDVAAYGRLVEPALLHLRDAGTCRRGDAQ